MKRATGRGLWLTVFAVLAFFFWAGGAHAAYVQPTVDRAKVQLNGSWKFIKSNTLTGAGVANFDDSTWDTVAVPHTWNAVASYFSNNRIADASNAWYRTHFAVPAGDAGKQIYVSFEGVFQVADVYVNGQYLGQHRGGYTRFTFDATKAIAFDGDNVLAVMVSNKDCADCLPDTNTYGWKGYGGIYRKVWLVKTNKYQVSTTDYASSGVYVTQSNVSTTSAKVSVRTVVTNNDTIGKSFLVKNFVADAAENVVLSMQDWIWVNPKQSASITQTGTIPSPRLWGPSDPYLYNVHANVWVDNTVADSVNERIGLRSYQLTSSDFVFNGASMKLRGVSKHQETETRGSAVSDADLITDWDNLQDLGVNFVRLVHYPHAELEYRLADERGLLVWAENGHSNSAAPTANGDAINQEMVYQNFNHPSIVFWSAGNEANGVDATSHYATVIKAADASRPVVYASNWQRPSNLDFIFDNTYPGWYDGQGSMYDWNTRSGHWVSESGAGMVITDQNADYFGMSHTVGQYEPEQFGQLVNEVKFQDLFVSNPSHVPAFSNWVFRDMSDNKYKGLINSKGLVTYSNYKKDIYYHFKSFARSSRVIHVVGPHYFLRSANSSGQGDVKAYSNAPALTLTVNGVNKGSLANGDYRHPNGLVVNNAFLWRNVLSVGRNDIVVVDGNGNSETATVYYKGTGSTMPAESGAKISNLASSTTANPAFYIRTPLKDQYPIYHDFDGTGDNTLDVAPALFSGADGWIATKRQSDSTKAATVSFKMATTGDVYVMFSKQPGVPSWLTAAGFVNTGATGRWRDNQLLLTDYQIYKKTMGTGTSVTLGGTAVDFLVVVK
jgi:beta-galactosidase